MKVVIQTEDGSVFLAEKPSQLNQFGYGEEVWEMIENRLPVEQGHVLVDVSISECCKFDTGLIDKRYAHVKVANESQHEIVVDEVVSNGEHEELVLDKGQLVSFRRIDAIQAHQRADGGNRLCRKQA